MTRTTLDDADGKNTDTVPDTDMTYGDYLRLDAVLGAQRPLSSAHDEMLFIVQHQTSELWMRLIIHELGAARRSIGENALEPAFKMLARVSRVFEQLNGAWDVLRTMTPSEYTRFRDRLGSSSGFQSWQYRHIEFMLGNRDASRLRSHAHEAAVRRSLEEELGRPSVYDVSLRALHRAGVALPENVLERDVSGPYRPSDDVVDAWRTVYLEPERYWSLYQLGEKLVDLEDYFRRWRFNHVTTVERVIGFKRGTGGTAGVDYLKRMLEVELFPELWRVRTHL